MDLSEMRAERDRLDAEIAAAEKQACENWNTALAACEDALVRWLKEHKIEYTRRDRKNETIWDVGHGALTANFGFAGEHYGSWMRVESGRTLTLEWSEVPEPERMLAIVAALLNETPAAATCAGGC